LRDFKDTTEYITASWGDDTEKKIMGAIVSGIDALKDHPGIGVSLCKIIDFPTTYRYLFIEKNYVFYHLEDDTVFIIRIINERQDFMHLLFGVNK